MEKVFSNHPEFGVFNNPWYFPSVSAYTTLLESEGFEVKQIELIPRPTPMDDINHWLDIFANGVTEHLTPEEFETVKVECRDILKEKGWMVDCVCLRVRAVKK